MGPTLTQHMTTHVTGFESAASSLHQMLTHESGRESGVGPDFAVHFNGSEHNDLCHLVVCEGILQPVPQNDDQRQRFPQLMRTSGRPGCKYSSQFVQHPCLWSIQSLQMLFRSTSLRKEQVQVRDSGITTRGDGTGVVL